MPRSRFRVYEDDSASPTITTNIVPPGYTEPVLGIPVHIPRRRPVPAHLNTPGPAAAAAPAPSGGLVSAALADPSALPFWPPWRERDYVDKGRRDAEYRLSELRHARVRGVEMGDGNGEDEEEVLLEMEEAEVVMRGERRKLGRGKKVWGWVKKRLGWGRKRGEMEG